jgi:hypothetical protein
MVNELDERSRAALLETLLDAASTGVGVLIVEPIATRATPWWQGWSDEFARLGGRASEWRFPVQLPNWLAKLDRAAGMHHDELTAKSLYIGPRAPF